MNRKYFDDKLNIPTDGRKIAAAPMSNLLRRAGFPEGRIPFLVAEYRATFAKEFTCEPFAHIKQLLHRLQYLRDTIVWMGVVTSNTKTNVVRALRYGGIDADRIFDEVFGIDTPIPVISNEGIEVSSDWNLL